MTRFLPVFNTPISLVLHVIGKAMLNPFAPSVLHQCLSYTIASLRVFIASVVSPT